MRALILAVLAIACLALCFAPALAAGPATCSGQCQLCVPYSNTAAASETASLSPGGASIGKIQGEANVTAVARKLIDRKHSANKLMGRIRKRSGRFSAAAPLTRT
jgi:hypothetical protein